MIMETSRSFWRKHGKCAATSEVDNDKGVLYATAPVMAEPTAQKVAWVQQAAKARWEKLECSILIVRAAVTNDRLGAAQAIAEGWAHAQITPSQVLESPHVLIGSVDELIADIYDRRARYGISHLAIFDDLIDEFAPVVVQLAGK
jgi:hypothetical protein